MHYIKFTLFSVLAYLIGQQFTQFGNYWINVLVELPGTFFHEAAHYGVAVMMGGHPQNFTIVPDGDTLGSIMFVKTWYNAAPVSLAPVLLLPLAFFFVVLACNTTSAVKLILSVYFAACSWASCVPSSQDFSVALSQPGSWPFAGILFGFVFYASFFMIKRTLNRV